MWAKVEKKTFCSLKGGERLKKSEIKHVKKQKKHAENDIHTFV